MTEKLFTTKELAAYLNIAVSTIMLYRADGTGPAYIKMGRLVRYRASAVDAWLAQKDSAGHSQSLGAQIVKKAEI